METKSGDCEKKEAENEKDVKNLIIQIVNIISIGVMIFIFSLFIALFFLIGMDIIFRSYSVSDSHLIYPWIVFFILFSLQVYFNPPEKSESIEKGLPHQFKKNLLMEGPSFKYVDIDDDKYHVLKKISVRLEGS